MRYVIRDHLTFQVNNGSLRFIIGLHGTLKHIPKTYLAEYNSCLIDKLDKSYPVSAWPFTYHPLSDHFNSSASRSLSPSISFIYILLFRFLLYTACLLGGKLCDIDDEKSKEWC